jgi:hypothetical protein
MATATSNRPSLAAEPRSMAVSAPMMDARLGERTAFRIVVHDVDGATTEIREKR